MKTNKLMKCPSSYMEEDYRSMAFYLQGANCHFIYMKTSQGKNKRGLGIFEEDNPKNMRYIYFNSSNEKGKNDDSLDYIYIKERTLIAHVISYKEHPIEQLRQLYQATDFDYSSIIYKAVKMAHLLRCKTIPISVLRYPHIFTKLRLASMINKKFEYKIKFVDNPPSLSVNYPPFLFPE
jgi:hypothetical protein